MLSPLRGEKRSFEIFRPGYRFAQPPANGWHPCQGAESLARKNIELGSLRLDNLSVAERAGLGLAENGLALRARHVGEYGDHAAAKNAGFRKGDVLVEIDGKTGLLTESQMMTRLANEKRPGDRVPVVVSRNGQRLKLELPIR